MLESNDEAISRKRTITPGSSSARKEHDMYGFYFPFGKKAFIVFVPLFLAALVVGGIGFGITVAYIGTH